MKPAVAWLAGRVPPFAVWVMSGISIGAIVALGPIRMMSPLEFGYGDGLMLDQLVRVAHGRPLYVAPSLEFIPLAYMPLYTYLVAPLVAWFGPQFWPGRLVSLLSSLGLAALIATVIRREGGRWAFAVAGAGLFLMGQGFSRGSYDTIRPDPLMLLLAFAGLATLRFSRGNAGAVGAAALLSAAFFTKQHALCFGVAALLHLVVSDRRRLPAFGIALLVGCAGGFALLSLLMGPWFSFYVYDVPSHWSQWSMVRMRGYLVGDLFGQLGALSMPALLSLMLPMAPWRGPAGLWWWVGLGGVATGLLATLDPWAYYHVLIPTLAAFAILGPLALTRLIEWLSGGPGSATPNSGLSIACVVLVLQFVALLYPVRSMLPVAGAPAARAAFDARLREFPGPVILPSHGFFAWSAGKGTALHTLPLDDVLRAPGNRLLAHDPLAIDRLFDRLRRGPGRPIIVSDTTLEHTGDRSAPLWASLAGSYRLSGRLGELSVSLRPRIGYRGAPSYIYEPIEPADSTAAPPAAAAPPAGARR